MRNAVTALAAIVLFLGANATTRAETDPLEAFGLIRYEESKRAPEFALPALDGATVELSGLRGRVVVLNIWATWCPACRDEMPSLERLHREFDSQGVSVLAASLREDHEDVETFVREFKLTMPTLLDRDGRVGERYGIQWLPTTFLIGPDGRLIARAIGPKDWAGVEASAVIRKLLQGRGTKR
ncbi:MAG: TlpA family protein disulfide reductase [Candidatus Rokubacteria bacterium]|nr:TlpA family protein disulfide reductase [Candidatus Rokubacteria bacterium]